MTKSYYYNSPVYNSSGEHVDDEVITVTEDQIIKEYYSWWEAQMIKKFGVGHYLITPEQCIEDWIVVNWAWESKWK